MFWFNLFLALIINNIFTVFSQINIDLPFDLSDADGFSYEYTDCNLDSFQYPVGVCIPYSSSQDIYVECSSRYNEIIWYYYESGECGTDGARPTDVDTYDIDEYGGLCDQDRNCEYFQQTCDGVVENIFVADPEVCITTDDNESYKMDCKGSKLTIQYYQDDKCKEPNGDKISYDFSIVDDIPVGPDCNYYCGEDDPTESPTPSPTCPECPICETGTVDDSDDNDASNSNNSSNDDDDLKESTVITIIISVISGFVLIILGILRFLREQSRDDIYKKIELKKIELQSIKMKKQKNNNRTSNYTGGIVNGNTATATAYGGSIVRNNNNSIGNNNNNKFAKADKIVLSNQKSNSLSNNVITGGALPNASDEIGRNLTEEYVQVGDE